MLITNLISRYMKLCKAAFSAGDGAKLNKSIQKKRHGNAFSFDGHPKEMQFHADGTLWKAWRTMLSADGRAQRELARNEYVAECFRLQAG